MPAGILVNMTATRQQEVHQVEPGWPPTTPPTGRRPPGPGLARIGLYVLVAVAAVAAFTRIDDLLPSFGNPFSSESVDRSQPSLLQAVDDLNEYHAATGQFQVIVDIEDDTRYVPSFLKGERTVFLAGGSVDAFVDFSDLAEDAIEVSEDGRAVTVHLPNARLSEPRIDPERSYVLERDRGLLDRAGSVFSDSPTGERELYLLAEEKLAAAAAEGELVERAEENTRSMLETMFTSLGYDDVTVVYEGHPAA